MRLNTAWLNLGLLLISLILPSASHASEQTACQNMSGVVIDGEDSLIVQLSREELKRREGFCCMARLDVGRLVWLQLLLGSLVFRC